jgi:hypothetical protein
METNKHITVRLTNNDKYIPLTIEHEFDYLKVLSLKIMQSDLYTIKNANYGVLVGKVTNNNGIGVPNVKVSIFIPLEEGENEVITNIYPFKTLFDNDMNGYRYNLLPKQKQHIYHKPIGTFLSTNEIVSSELEYVYDKYYKYTTSTNINGDYMFVGTPVGEYDVFVDCDISDIDVLSIKPHNLIANGYNKNLFESGVEFKSGRDLNSLPQVSSTSSKIYLKSFWGDEESGVGVGINRQDFKLPFNLTPTAIFCGALATFDEHAFFRTNCSANTFKSVSGNKNWRSVIFSEERLRSSKGGKIECIRETLDGGVEIVEVNGDVDENGVFIVEVPMNLGYKIFNNEGDLIDSNDNFGIPTKANVRFRISINNNNSDNEVRTAYHLCPSVEDSDNKWNLDYNLSDFKTYRENNKKYPFVELNMNSIYSIFYSGIPYSAQSGVNQDKNSVFKLRSYPVISLCTDIANGVNNPFPYQCNVGDRINEFNDKTNMERYDLCNVNGVNGTIVFYPFQSHGNTFCSSKLKYKNMAYLTLNKNYNFGVVPIEEGRGMIFRNENNEYYYEPIKFDNTDKSDANFNYTYVNYLDIIKIGELKTELKLDYLLPNNTTNFINFEDRKDSHTFLFRVNEMGIDYDFPFGDKTKDISDGDIELKPKRVSFLVNNNYIDKNNIDLFIEGLSWLNRSNYDSSDYLDYIKSGRNFLFYFGVVKGNTTIDKLKNDYF